MPEGEAQAGQTVRDLPLEEHVEGVLAEARLLLEDLLLEHQPLAVAAVLLQGLADEVQACWQREIGVTLGCL